MSILRGHRPSVPPSGPPTHPPTNPAEAAAQPFVEPPKSQKKKLADPHGQHRRRRCPPATGKIAVSNPIDGVDFSANRAQHRNRQQHPLTAEQVAA